MDLFSVGGVGVTLKSFKPEIEKRDEERVRVIVAVLVVESFGPVLAASLDEGLTTNVKRLLFDMQTAKPTLGIETMNLDLGCPPQDLAVHAAPDVEKASHQLRQAKITNAVVRRTDKADYSLTFNAKFSPAGPDDFKFLMAWFKNTQFVTFRATEPVLEVEVPGGGSVAVTAKRGGKRR